MRQRRGLRRGRYAQQLCPIFRGVFAGEHVAELCTPQIHHAAAKRIDRVGGAIDDHYGNRLVGLAAIEILLYGHACRDRGDAGEILRVFQRQAVGELCAIGPAGGEDALPVDRVRRYLEVEKAFDETGVVDLQLLGGKWRAAAAIVPGVADPIRIHDQESVLVRQFVEFVIGIFAHTRGIAPRRMQHEQ
jgi:hypothetical protein